MNRTIPLACALWLVAIVVAAPHAAQVTPAPSVRPPAGPDPHNPETLFTPSANCVACHNNLITPAGEDVSIGATWRSTMMANSARDPYWQGSVRRETVDFPMHSADIQHECAACHMPMLQKVALALDKKADVFGQLPISSDDNSNLHALAADGVSCAVCHQVSDEGLGTRANFNANFTMRPTPPDGARVMFGPFQVDRGRKTIMRSVTGFVQAKAPHIQQSELCATCHTLITQAFGPNGEVIGSIAEQMNYQEWQHSAFSEGEAARSCQSCHMPTVRGQARASSVLGDFRDDMRRHLFVGSNFLVVRMLNRFRGELGVEALPSEMEATAKATIRLLEEETATLSITRNEVTAGKLNVEVAIKNLTGHKFPSGYPSRRSWLHVTVRDRQGRTVFESGAVTSKGLIQGNDNDADPAKYEPHYDLITSADQVQIYESIIADRNDVPTTGLLTATHYIKDNRLLPRGFDKTTADKDIGVFGAAMQDDNFTAEGDRIRYALDLPAGAGPFVVSVELLFQPIGYRWAHNLDKYDAAEPKRFVGYYNEMSSASWAPIATATSSTP